MSDPTLTKKRSGIIGTCCIRLDVFLSPGRAKVGLLQDCSKENVPLSPNSKSLNYTRVCNCTDCLPSEKNFSLFTHW